MAFTQITADDLQNKGVVGLADTPNLSTVDMQKKFDEIATDVIVPKHNGLIDELEAKEAAASLGAVDGNGNPSTVQAELNGIKQQGYTKAETDALLATKAASPTNGAVVSPELKSATNGREVICAHALPPATSANVSTIDFKEKKNFLISLLFKKLML